MIARIRPVPRPRGIRAQGREECENAVTLILHHPDEYQKTRRMWIETGNCLVVNSKLTVSAYDIVT